RITLRWIAAHENVKGNERADEEAKKAAAGSTTPNRTEPNFGITTLQQPLPFSAGIAKTQYMFQLKAEWKEKWNISPRKERFNNVDPDFPFNKFRKIQEGLTRS
ncbi:hypothetical protein BYT27DRAFT_7028124, partial [Phlegmacium glaucopus]